MNYTGKPIETMNKQEAFELVPLYALGALDETEILAFEQLLAQDVDLQTELDQYGAVVDVLPLFATAQPAPNLEAKLRERIRAQSSSGAQTPVQSKNVSNLSQYRNWVLAAAAVIVVLLVGIIVLNPFAEDDETERITTAQRIENILNDPNQRRFEVQPKDDFNSIAGALIVDESGKFGVLQLEGVTNLPEGQDFQMWFIIDGEDRISGGVFDSTAENTVLHFVELPENFDAFESVGVTVEPDGGSPAPTGASVLSAPLLPTQS